MTQISQRKLDVTALQNIIAKRAMIKVTDVGATLRFHVQGNGNVIPVTRKDGSEVESLTMPGTQLMKRIHNIKANSQLAMMNDRNRAILNEAVKAEAAGDVDTVHDRCNEYLNKVQVSFNVLLPNKHEFYDGQLIEGEVVLIENETTDDAGNAIVGRLLTIENPRPVLVAKASKTPAFTLADLLGVADDEHAPEDTFTPATQGAATKPEAGA